MTVGDFLAQATEQLTAAGIASARLDCLVVLETKLSLDRALLLAHPERKIDLATEVELNTIIAQRIQHRPLAYLLGTAPFYGRDFVVSSNVLVPRPESEAMIDLLKQLALPAKPRIADVGTGSGCLGITAVLELQGAHVDLYDIDQKALKVATQNASKHKAEVHSKRFNLLPQTAAYDVVLANLPYVPDAYPINQAAQHEPRLALFGGVDGLEVYRRFWECVIYLTSRPSYLLTESLLAKHKPMAQLAARAGYKLTKTQGLVQQFTLTRHLARRPK